MSDVLAVRLVLGQSHQLASKLLCAYAPAATLAASARSKGCATRCTVLYVELGRRPAHAHAARQAGPDSLARPSYSGGSRALVLERSAPHRGRVRAGCHPCHRSIGGRHWRARCQRSRCGSCRRSAWQHDDTRPDPHASVEVHDILVSEPDAARGHERADG